MPRVLLYNGAGYLQQFPNSCWACCTRFVNNYYVSQGAHGQNIFSDSALAAMLHMQPNAQTDIHDVLTQCHMHDGQDSEYIPQFSEITAEIDAGRMICVCVNPTRHGYLCDTPMVGGHYVVIIGYDTNQNQICVMDPANGSIAWQSFQQTSYIPPVGGAQFWCGTVFTNGLGAS
ncbi:MAG: C39 family peptidase [Cyclobacteriaceae bacterium]